MDAYIPIAKCQKIDVDILNLLINNELVDDIHIHPTEEYYPRGDNARYKAIAYNCLDIYKMAIKKGDEIFLMCNSNNMAINMPHLDQMYEYIMEHTKCGMVAHNDHKGINKQSGHIRAGFSLLRTEAVKGVIFEEIALGRHHNCHCSILTFEIRRGGFEACYVV